MVRVCTITLISLLVFYCKTKQVIVREKQLVLDDNYWLSENKIQFVTEAKAQAAPEPLVYLRDKSCAEAEKLGEAKAFALHKKLKQISGLKKEVVYRLFVGEGACKVVIHFSAPGLKNALN